MARAVLEPLSPDASPRIGVVMLSTVGNAVHVLPVLNSIKAHAPGAQITWIMQPGPAELVRGHPAVAEILTLDRSRGLRGWLELRRELASRSFDILLVLQDYFKAGLVAGMARAPIKIGLGRGRARDFSWLFVKHPLPAQEPGHVQDQYLEYLEPLGVPARLEWGLEPTSQERARYAGLLPAGRPIVAMVVGTTRPEKEWPLQRYALLADRLHDELGATTVLVGGKSDRETLAAQALNTLADHPPLNLLESDLRRLLFLIGEVDVLVTPDTGPLHMAVARGTPTVALMGHTNPKRVGPYRHFQDLLIDAYGEPGEDYPADGGTRAGRMERISVDQVVERVKLALERYPRSAPAGQPAP